MTEVFFLRDPNRYEDGAALVPLTVFFGPVVAPVVLASYELSEFIQRNDIQDADSLQERVLDSRTNPDPKPVLKPEDAAFLLKWARLSKNPKAWAEEFKKDNGGRIMEQYLPSMKAKVRKAAKEKVGGNIFTGEAPFLPGLAKQILGPENGVVMDNEAIQLSADLLETLFFWVYTLEKSNIAPEIGIAIDALNIQAPMAVEFITESIAALLSPIGVFPFSDLVFQALGQMAAYPFITFAVYMNVSRGDYMEALRLATMFLLFIGPFVSTSAKTVGHVYEKVKEKWESIINIPERIMVVPNKIGAVFKRLDEHLGVSDKVNKQLSQVSSLVNDAAQRQDFLEKAQSRARLEFERVQQLVNDPSARDEMLEKARLQYEKAKELASNPEKRQELLDNLRSKIAPSPPETPLAETEETPSAVPPAETEETPSAVPGVGTQDEPPLVPEKQIGTGRQTKKKKKQITRRKKKKQRKNKKRSSRIKKTFASMKK
jgi:hypothetical protein